MILQADRQWAGKRAVVLGVARQGVAVTRYLVNHGAHVVVSDLRRPEDLTSTLGELEGLGVPWVLGDHPFSLLDRADVLVLSGGVPVDAPIVVEATERGIALSNDSQMFLDACPAVTVGITGSAGKTTTTALVGEMARVAGEKVWVGGNIGRSMLPDLELIQPVDLVVTELSSFQLEIMTRGTHVAAILNLTPNHLDRHKTMEVYTAAKARLLQFQPTGGIAVLGQDGPGAWALAGQAKGRLRSFSQRQEVRDGAFLRDARLIVRDAAGEQIICTTDEVLLRGQHNLLNILAAGTIADSVGIPVEAMAEVARTFRGVEHRLEWVREQNGVNWYDDSIATAPERLVAALEAFDEPILLLAGGRDKMLPWADAAACIHRRVRVAVLFGESAELISRHLGEPAGKLERIVHVDTLERAVHAAATLAKPGEVILLSPGGTSFDAYADFVERGDHFKDLVRSL